MPNLAFTESSLPPPLLLDYPWATPKLRIHKCTVLGARQSSVFNFISIYITNMYVCYATIHGITCIVAQHILTCDKEILGPRLHKLDSSLSRSLSRLTLWRPEFGCGGCKREGRAGTSNHRPSRPTRNSGFTEPPGRRAQ